MSSSFTVAFTVNPVVGVNNTLTLTDKTGAGVTNYPLQFGRPFLQGAIPAGQVPQVLINGSPAPSTQIDIKCTYPDGSVKHAILATVIPSIPPNGSVTLSFAPISAIAPVPLTTAQMLDTAYDFDAKISFISPAANFGAPLVAPNATLSTWQAITSGGFSFSVNNTPYQVTGLDFSIATELVSPYNTIVTVASIIEAALKAANVPATFSWQAIANPGTSTVVNRTVLTTTGFTGSETISVAGPPLSGVDISAMLGLTTGTLAQGTTQIVSARNMLTNGDYTLWTQGAVAQTIILGDDSPTRKYDVGFGDGFHPLRPRFYATFWPATHQVSVRVVAENDLVNEVEDLTYKATVSLGASSPATVYAADLSGTNTGTNPPKAHWAMSNWTQSFWLGATPPAQVNIDNNLAYLANIRFLPCYDTSIVVSATGITTEYAQWTSKPHDIYDGTWDGGMWMSPMPSAGARQDIAPYPAWTVLWLYTGDWRMRQVALGLADIAASYPGNLRESVSSKRLSRTDPVSSSTGLGHTISITDRTTITTKNLSYFYTHVADGVRFVGGYNSQQPWKFDEAHQPSAFYPQYLLTGDPWYLQMMYLWAGYSAAAYNGASTGPDGRGPGGLYGVINDELRGAAWTIRNRAEAAFIAPDADPEKAYFTYLVNDALARWCGSLGITGTPYDGTTIYQWGITVGNYYSANGGPESGKPPPFGNWQSNGFPNGKDATITGNTSQHLWDVRSDGAPIVGSFVAPWMAWYLQYGLGRTTELGFAAGLLCNAHGQYPIGMILDSGTPHLIGAYEVPVEADATPLGAYNTSPPLPLSVPPGGFMTTWAQLVSGFTQAFLTGVGWQSSWNGGAGDLDQYFARELNDDGRPIWLMSGLAMMVDAGDLRALSAWEWFVPNVYQAISLAALQGDPKWVIVPRTDNNILPAQPTFIP